MQSVCRINLDYWFININSRSSKIWGSSSFVKYSEHVFPQLINVMFVEMFIQKYLMWDYHAKHCYQMKQEDMKLAGGLNLCVF